MTGPRMLAAAASAALLMAGTAQAQNYTIKLVAGAPGYDHIQPFMAEQLKFWDKYGLKVDFMGGNYIRSNQMMSIGDFDVGYNQVASAVRTSSSRPPPRTAR
jgi:NitT/TauT family transport system substrate-binding protein